MLLLQALEAETVWTLEMFWIRVYGRTHKTWHSFAKILEQCFDIHFVLRMRTRRTYIWQKSALNKLLIIIMDLTHSTNHATEDSALSQTLLFSIVSSALLKRWLLQNTNLSFSALQTNHNTSSKKLSTTRKVTSSFSWFVKGNVESIKGLIYESTYKPLQNYLLNANLLSDCLPLMVLFFSYLVLVS